MSNKTKFRIERPWNIVAAEIYSLAEQLPNTFNSDGTGNSYSTSNTLESVTSQSALDNGYARFSFLKFPGDAYLLTVKADRTNTNRASGEITRGSFLSWYDPNGDIMKPLYDLVNKLDGIVWE